MTATLNTYWLNKNRRGKPRHKSKKMELEKQHIINSVKGGAGVIEYIRTHEKHNLSDMSRHTGVSVPTLKRAIARFIERGIIVEVQRAKTFSPAVYEIVK